MNKNDFFFVNPTSVLDRLTNVFKCERWPYKNKRCGSK